MKIGVYASARNEETNLHRWFASCLDADAFAINDTGSTDGTFDVLRSLEMMDPRARVAQIPIEPMRLSNALNVAMTLLPDDVDVAIRLDLDERLSPGWREAIELLDFTSPTIAQCWFDHMGTVYRHDRVHSRHGFHWELPVHEILIADVPAHRTAVELTIEHHQDPTKDRSQVLGELEAALEADPDNLRLLHYLGREYTYRSDWGNAIPLLRRHADSDAVAEERSESWRLLGEAYVALMDPADVPVRPFQLAALIAPERREGWLALAEYHFTREAWGKCRAAASRALDVTEHSWYLNWPWAWGARPYDLIALASWFLGDADEAIRCGERALELDPDDTRLAENLRWYRTKGDRDARHLASEDRHLAQAVT